MLYLETVGHSPVTFYGIQAAQRSGIQAWDELGACELSGAELRKLLDGARARSAMREDLSNALSELALGGRLELSERDETPPDLSQLAEELRR